MEKKNIITNIILPEDLWEEAKFRAAKDKMSLSEVIRKALTEYLLKQDPEIRKRRGKEFGKRKVLRGA